MFSLLLDLVSNSLLEVSCSFIETNLDDSPYAPPSSAMLQGGFAPICSLFLRGVKNSAPM
jgi:hypothetical protein